MNGRFAMGLSSIGMLVWAGCLPDVDVRSSVVGAPTVIAVRAEPAEVRQGDRVTFTALYADSEGEYGEAPLDWAFCLARKGLAELGPVSRACLGDRAEDFVELGAGSAAVGTVPRDACRLFGPNPPPALPGEPAGRPVDPDVTGGYYVPVRVQETGAPTRFSDVRLTCDPAGVSPETFIRYNQCYRLNTAPEVASLTVRDAGGVEQTLSADEATTATVPPGARVTLRARWAECPTATGLPASDACPIEASCNGAETYVVVDPQSRLLGVRRESMRVSWFVTAGSVADDVTGTLGADPTTFSDDVYVAPAAPALVRVWAVLRDERGGVGWRAFLLRVQ